MKMKKRKYTANIKSTSNYENKLRKINYLTIKINPNNLRRGMLTRNVRHACKGERGKQGELDRERYITLHHPEGKIEQREGVERQGPQLLTLHAQRAQVKASKST